MKTLLLFVSFFVCQIVCRSTIAQLLIVPTTNDPRIVVQDQDFAWILRELSTGNLTWAGAWETTESQLGLTSRIVASDIGYAINFSAAGTEPATLGNYHLSETDWITQTSLPLDEMAETDDFTIQSVGYLLHPSTGNTKHARIARSLRINSQGVASENIYIEWLTNGNQLNYFNVGQLSMGNSLRFGVAYGHNNPVIIENTDSENDHAFVGVSQSATWTTDNPWFARIKTNAAQTIIRESTGKIYPRTELGSQMRDAGELDTANWTWTLEQVTDTTRFRFRYLRNEFGPVDKLQLSDPFSQSRVKSPIHLPLVHANRLWISSLRMPNHQLTLPIQNEGK